MNQTNYKKNANLGNKEIVSNAKIVSNTKISNTSAKPSGYSGTSVFGMILLLIVILVVGYASYWLYNYYNTKSFVSFQEAEVLTDVKNANNLIKVASGTIPNSSYSNEYSISLWVNIQDYNYKYGSEKVILRRGDAGSGNPEIVLAEKSNDLIFRVKLQGSAPTVSNFQDIPILLQEDIEDLNMQYQTENQTKENFNIVSTPAPVMFHNENDNNYKALLDTNLNISDNQINYPTIKYISSNNENYNDQYFSMISGNNINNIKKLQSVENFDDTADATNIVVNIFTDICNVINLLESTATSMSSNDLYVLTNSILLMIIGFIVQMNSIVKTGAANFDTITAAFKQNLNNIYTNADFNKNVDKLAADILSLNSYIQTKIDYANLVSIINSSLTSKIKNCMVVSGINTEFKSTNTLIDNVIILLQEAATKTNINMMNENNPVETTPSKLPATCIIDSQSKDDPTIGKCMVKMIPLQKWVSIIVSVYNQVVDIYIDGQLSSSCVLKSFPAISTADVNITPDGGFTGMISRVNFMNSAMTIQQAKNIYYDGPISTESMFSLIPNWVYWGLLIIVIIAIVYSFFA
jgi:hypothetical protein